MASKRQSHSVVLLTVSYEIVSFWAVRICSEGAVYKCRKGVWPKLQRASRAIFLPDQLLIPGATYDKHIHLYYSKFYSTCYFYVSFLYCAFGNWIPEMKPLIQ